MANKNPGRNGWTALYQRPGRKTGLANDSVTVSADEDGRGDVFVGVYFHDSQRKVEIHFKPTGEIVSIGQISTPRMSDRPALSG